VYHIEFPILNTTSSTGASCC